MSAKIENEGWVYVKRPDGEVSEDCYQLQKLPLPALQDGDILIKSLMFSCDPYMRIQQAKTKTWQEPYRLNELQLSYAVGEVLESKCADFKHGDIVSTYTGWQKYAVLPGSKASKLTYGPGYEEPAAAAAPSSSASSAAASSASAGAGAGAATESKSSSSGSSSSMYKTPRDIPIAFSISLLGMPGRTAYFGLLEAGKPKAGEVLVVSGAAGAVGSIVCQIGKILGCFVIGVAGSAEKCKFLTDECGCDVALDYHDFKTVKDAREALDKASGGRGIDIYFDNVGGTVTDAVFELINLRARVVICGQISQYNEHLDEVEMGPRFLHRLIYTRATIQGVLARDYIARHDEMVAQMTQWLLEGKLRYRITEVKGFDQLPKALQGLFHGINVGKLVVSA